MVAILQMLSQELLIQAVAEHLQMVVAVVLVAQEL